MTIAETVDWIEERQRGVLTDAWYQAYLYALTKTKKFPKAPSELWKTPGTPEDVAASLVAGAKARKAAQEMEARLKKMGKERVIRREE